jgi:hypothetical protein
MFSHHFQQGGLGVELFSSSGKNPVKEWKVTQNVHRVYDKTVKGFVYLLDKGSTTQMSIPPDSKESLGILQPLLVLQIRLQHGKHFGFELIVIDDRNQRRRMYFSTIFRDFESNDFHVQIPLELNNHDGWNNLVIDMNSIVSTCSRGSRFHSLEYVCVKPVCRIRKIFSLPSSADGKVRIPATFEFPSGTDFQVQVSINGAFIVSTAE